MFGGVDPRSNEFSKFGHVDARTLRKAEIVMKRHKCMLNPAEVDHCRDKIVLASVKRQSQINKPLNALVLIR